MHKLLILICMGILPMQIFAQTRSIHSMPKKERDSIILLMAKKAVMTYGPDYYRDKIPPVITYEGTWDNQFNYYTVEFLYDQKREKFRHGFAALVHINADQNLVFRIHFGNAAVFYAPFPDTIVPLQYKVELPEQKIDYTSSLYTYLDSHIYKDKRVRDSLFSLWCNRYMQAVAPEYYEKISSQKIDTGRHVIPRNKESKFYRMTYYYVPEEGNGKQEFLMSLTSSVGSYVEYLNFHNGIEIDMTDHALCLNDTIKRDWYLAVCVPYMPDNLRLPKQRKTPFRQLPENVRDSILFQKGEEAVLAIGPTYYRRYQPNPVDTTSRVRIDDEVTRLMCVDRYRPNQIQLDTCRYGKNKGREFYLVWFPNGKEDQFFEGNFSARVSCWADSGQPFHIQFGNGTKVKFDGLDYRKMKPIVPFQDKLYRTDYSGKRVKP